MPVSKGHYAVPHPDRNATGVPRVLQLRESTGDGMAGSLPFSSTMHVGSRLASRKHQQYWVMQVFARAPVRPGYWQFKWEPRHGSEAMARGVVRAVLH